MYPPSFPLDAQRLSLVSASRAPGAVRFPNLPHPGSARARVKPYFRSPKLPINLCRQINRQNSLIYRLPPELITFVASYLHKKHLIKATHVSHRLRSILLSSSELWLDISFCTRREERMAFLERSGSRRISVSMSIRYPKCGRPEQRFLVNHAEKIETLDLSTTVTATGLCTQMRLPSMPSLKQLRISYFGAFGNLQYAMDDGVVFASHALKTLALRGGDGFPFNVPLLTKLQLDASVALSKNKLLDFLARCPQLEELEINYDGVSFFRISNADGRAIELPRLRYYSQSTSTQGDLHLFSCLLLPPSCSAVFNYWNGPRGRDESPESLKFENPSPLADIKRIKLKTGGGDETVELIDSDNDRVHMVMHVGRDLGQGDRFIMNEIYTSYLNGLRTDTADILCVEGPCWWDSLQAWKVLTPIDEIRTLVLSGAVAPPYIRALAPEPDLCYGTEGDLWPCPMLHKLVVHVHDFVDAEGENILDLLLRTVERRKIADMRIMSLSLFVRSPQDNRDTESYARKMYLHVKDIEIVTGDDVLDWQIDDYFFDKLDVRRDRYSFGRQRSELRIQSSN